MSGLKHLGMGSQFKQCVFVCLLLWGIGCSTIMAQSNQPTPTKPGQGSSPTSGDSHYLRITINPSTANIIEGAVYGLDAEIENMSNVPVTIDISQIELAVQPELAPPNVSCTWFYDAVSNESVPSPLVMRPGDHFTVFFDAGSSARPDSLKKVPQCEATFWTSLRRRLDFVPGNFSFVVTGIFKFAPPSTPTGSPSTAANGQSTLEEHYFTEKASLPVTIDQAQIIIYAGLGGLLAFLVMTFRSANTLWEYAGRVQTSRKGSVSKAIIILRQASAAVLLSITVTVVAARLSTTAFPVKVSVEDFWGALTVGFVAYFIGGRFIDKLSETLGGNGAPVTPAPVTPAPVTPAPATPAPATPAPDATDEGLSNSGN